MPDHPLHVIVGLSGGVDSAVAAWKLLQQGHEVRGLFMKNWEEDDGSPLCTAKEDYESAKKAAATLGIELLNANFSAEYWDGVFEIFLSEYEKNRVPNPDVLCNKAIKFDAFLQYAKNLGADKIATGHYVRTQDCAGRTRLLKGIDTNKDQAYFLHALSSDQLHNCIFPLGEHTKSEVRAIAKKIGLPNYDRKDSTGVCFIGERRFKTFLSRYLPSKPGNIITHDKKVVGKHSGILYYTLGQRKGLGIGGQKNLPESPWFVAEKRAHDNTLVVVQDAHHPALYSPALLASQPHWIHSPPMPADQKTLVCQAKLRHRQPDVPCAVSFNTDGTLTVEFKKPQRAINPGQYVVFYNGGVCLGGATIERSLAAAGTQSCCR